MKRTLLLLFMLLGLFATVQAQSGLALSMDNLEAKPGETKTVNVSLTNPGKQIIAVQFTMTLPDGVTVIRTGTKKPVLNPDRIGSEYDADAEEDIPSEKGINVGSTNPYTFSIFSTADQIPFAGEEGPIMTLNIKVGTTAAISTGEIKLSGIELTEKGAANPTNLPDCAANYNIYEAYNISVSANDVAMGTVTGGTEEAMSGAAMTVTANPSTGYDFVNWTEGETVVSTDAAYNFTPTGDRTLVANFTPHIYTATFNSEGKSENKQIAFGANVEAPTPADKTGYTFSAWDNLPETMPAQNITVTAQYTATPYAITYDLSGGALAEGVTNAATYTIESEAITLNNPTRTGYTFAGWTGTGLEAATTEVTIATGSMEARSYTATWTPVEYAISYDLSGGELAEGVTNAATYTIESEAITLNNPTRTGYTFAGWTGTGLEAATTEVTIATGSMEARSFTATWTPVEYAISYDLSGGELAEGVTNAATYTIESDAITLNNPTRTGYTFAGWTGTGLEAATTEVTIATGSMEARSYTATWTPVEYAISYDLSGGALAEGVTNAATYTIESDAITLNNPTRTGYTFAGWTGTGLEAATTEVTIATGSMEARSYTATWTPVEYAISYDLSGGELAEGVTNAATYTIESEAITLNNPTRTGYTFAGWTGTGLEAATAEVTIATGSMEARSYVATWTINQYTVQFVADGADVYNQKQDYNSAITAPDAPTKTGYTFKEWTPAVAATVPAEDVLYTAVYDVNKYKLTFVVDGQSNVTEVDYNGVITAPENPTKTGYTFTGWDADIATTMPANDLTYTAQFTINQYTVQFVADGADVYNQKQDYNSAITAPDAPTKTGYTFKEWTPAVAATVPAEDVLYTAVYDVNKYKLTFVVDGQSNVTEVDYNGVITAPENPTKTGYTFTGWDADIATTMPANDLTYTAQFTINQYTVQFVADGVDVYNQKQDYNSVITAPADPTKTGYTFKGWTPTVAATVPAEDVLYTAVYEVNKYVLTYMVDGEVYKTYYDVEYGEAITPEQEPTKENYEFSGWSEIPSTMPANDVIVTGTFTWVDSILGIAAPGSGAYQIYTSDGTPVQALQKGMNIIRFKNGQVKKVMVK